MTTQFEAALEGTVTPAMEKAAAAEGVSPDMVRLEVAEGRAVIPANTAHSELSPVVVGKAFTTKVNANIGRSPDLSSQDEEICKLNVALSAGADFVMDLSVGPDTENLRSAMLAASPMPLGTVPIYEAAVLTGDGAKLDPEQLFRVIEEQAKQGVDFMTLHAGFLQAHVELASRRLMGIVSRGGTIMARWMMENKAENPIYENWDTVLDICSEYDVTLSLGDGLRPGCLADASDDAQFAELDVLGELVERCRQRGVQAMVEGPGHVPFNEIQMNMERQQEVCNGAPFYVLGPVVTDIAPGYDHITSCIGATAAAYYGASLLCYVTPAEHLGLPSSEEVHEGVMAYRIAAHAADVAKGLPGARKRDDDISVARRALDWNRQFELALDGDRARARYEKTKADSGADDDFCSMCGRDFCAVRTTQKLFDA